MSAASAAPMAISISTCTPRAASAISASLSAPADRGDPRDLRRGPQGHLGRGGKPQAAAADRQGLQVRRYRRGVRPHGSQQAPWQDRGDAVGARDDFLAPHRSRRRTLFRGTALARWAAVVRRLHGADAAESSPSSEREQHATFADDTPCGLGFLPDGTLIVLTMHRQRLMRYAGGELSLYAGSVRCGLRDHRRHDRRWARTRLCWRSRLPLSSAAGPRRHRPHPAGDARRRHARGGRGIALPQRHRGLR